MLSKTELSGTGLTSCIAGRASRFTLKFYDEFDNAAVPSSTFKLGLALLQNQSYKDVESHMYDFCCINEPECVYEVSFTAAKDGQFSLWVWSDEMNEQSMRMERVPFAGSPFHCAVSAGVASAETRY